MILSKSVALSLTNHHNAKYCRVAKQYISSLMKYNFLKEEHESYEIDFSDRIKFIYISTWILWKLI